LEQRSASSNMPVMMARDANPHPIRIKAGTVSPHRGPRCRVWDERAR
jgi:hypothetical protein